MKARIYKPTRTAMQQSGQADNNHWFLEFERQSALFIDPLMGWTGTRDNTQQLRMAFSSAEEAEEYAKRNNIEYEIKKSEHRTIKPKNYAANFAFNRVIDTPNTDA